ncbi:ribosomal protein S18-alanine N-acetyltransferase [uncultured Desulfovibrio sp.]|uniref:ribosomal protein S18-alanine N-acetyltransferase n=1 Tax=uncultured Desulfovibrio sp. TaxID=167968 RepID=UPI00261F9F55|nr:ribosomal protein S18-alanine N-acetyltransferase [uncultured Desulfovibrio sp.]
MSGPSGAASLRRLDEADAVAMQRLEAACFPLPWSEEQCRAALGQRAFLAYGLFRDEALLGYIALYRAADELEVLNLAVLPAARRQGMGERLLRAALQEARKTGSNKALLEVRTGNAPAIALYEKCGFVRAGRRPRYYADTGEDALIYQCDLTPQD